MPSNWEYFRSGASVLVGPGPVKQRLTDAYLGHLRSVDVNALPADIRSDFLALASALNVAKATCGLNAVEATVRKMSEQEAGRHAASVLEMLVGLSADDTREHATVSVRQLRLVADDDDEIPAFLNRA